MSLTLEDVTLGDRQTISEIITHANWADPYGQIAWPDATFEERIAGSYARLPSTFLGEGAWFMKALLDGTAVAYAQWKFPTPVWKKLQQAHPTGGLPAEATEEMKKQFERESDESCVSEGWPKGLNREVVEALTPAMQAARERVFPKDEDYIQLNQVKTMPEFQGRGAGSLLMRWGCAIADREGLKIALEATPYGVPLYKKFGFVSCEEVHHDVSRFGGPERYTHTMMVREPKT